MGVYEVPPMRIWMRRAAHLEHLEEARGGVAGKQPHERKQQQHGGHEAAAVGGRQKAQHSKHERHHDHA
jgi:hypothetical protein